MPTQNDATRPFSLLVKPASADCNLRCAYCFYLDHSSLYPETNRHRMSDEVLERLIKSYMGTDQPNYSFGWQGGEPTLMGVDFFEKVVSLQKKYGKPGALVSNGLQTNVTMIDDEFAQHLAEYKFLVGASIDGPDHIHNTYRLNAAGSGSHDAVMKGVQALNRHNVEYNALILVSTANVEHPEEVYDYLLDMGIHYHQYIPCVEFDDRGNPLPYTITSAQWSNFLNRIYDRWVGTDTRKVSIRDFDALLQLLVNGTYSMCVHGGYCASYFVVEYNGDIYPCDFYVEKAKRLGSIMTDSWSKLKNSSRYRGFAEQKADWNDKCAACKYLRYCSGDCLKQRFYGTQDPKNLSWLCEGWEQFYSHTLSGFEKLAVSILNEQETQHPPQQRQFYNRLPAVRIGWNDPCFCGSGKKYRLCHGTAGSGKRKQ